MAKIIYLHIFFSCLLSTSMACDICSQYDYANLEDQHYLGFFYHRNVFNGYHTYQHAHHFSPSSAKLAHGGVGPTTHYVEPTQRDHQIMNVGELRYNHNFNDKYNLAVIIPFRHNKDHYSTVYPPIGPAEDSTSYSSGLGDIVITADKISTITNDTWSHRFKYGAGISLPTGRFSLEDDKGNPSEPILEPGIGGFAALLRFSYTLSKQQRWGIQTFSTYSRSIDNRAGDQLGSASPHFTSQYYRFGDILFNNITAFRTISWESIHITPRLGLTNEWRQPNELNNEQLSTTGHTVFFITPGIDIHYAGLTFRIEHNKPLWQQMNDEQLGHAGRFSTGVLYSF